MSRIQVAQSVVDSVADIRPHLRSRRVVSVEEITEEDGALVPRSALVHFDDGDTARFTGLYAKHILAAKDEPPARELLVELDREGDK